MNIDRKSVIRGLIIAFVLTLWLRGVLFIVGYQFASMLNPFPVTKKQMDFAKYIPIDKKDPWYYAVQPLHRFDALWYEEIALHEYTKEPAATAFFPLFPWLVKTIATLEGTSFAVSAFIANSILTFMTLFLLYLFSYQEYDKQTALRTVLVFSTFPTIFFLLAPYAEALLLSFLLASLLFAQRKNVFLSVVFASLGAITKPYAVVIVIPLALYFLRNNSLQQKIKNALFLVLIPLSFAWVLIYQNSQTGLAYGSLSAQVFWNMTLTRRVF